MQQTLETQKPQRKVSTQMRAVLMIFGADPYLMSMVGGHINLETETIHWDPILKFPWGSGHRAAVIYAYGVWTDEVRSRSNPFDAALSMNPALQMAALRALAIRWGLHSGLDEFDDNTYYTGGTI